MKPILKVGTKLAYRKDLKIYEVMIAWEYKGHHYYYFKNLDSNLFHDNDYAVPQSFHIWNNFYTIKELRLLKLLKIKNLKNEDK